MAEATFKQAGRSVDYTPTANVAIGEVVTKSDLVGIATKAITANVPGTIDVEGVFDVVKTSALAIAVGDEVYFNPVTREANKTAGVRASGTLTFTGVGVADQIVTIGNRVYTWKVAPAAADEVAIGANQAASEANLTAAINSGVGGSAPHTQVTAADVASTVVVTAIEYGTAPNAYATTEDGTNMSWGAATLEGGAGGPKMGKAIKAAANPSSLVRVKLSQ